MPPPEITESSCTSCGTELTLVCEPTEGFYDYKTYNEYFCSRCGKRNVALTTGAVLTVKSREHVDV